jgi:hypothetical protein
VDVRGFKVLHSLLGSRQCEYMIGVLFDEKENEGYTKNDTCTTEKKG